MAQTLGNVAIGNIVKLKLNGANHEFIVVHQGLPSSMYDSSCDGTWLLMKDIYEVREWHSSELNDYANSNIHNYLNNSFLNVFDSNIKNVIKQVKIPYCPGTGGSGGVATGFNGLLCKVFLMSAYEIGLWTEERFPQDGTVLAYFIYGATSDAHAKRIAFLNGSANSWWERTPFIERASTAARYIGYTNMAGNCGMSAKCPVELGARPAVILPQSLYVLDSGEVVINQSPIQPPSITVSEPVKGGKSVAVSWGTSSDPDGNLAGYHLERSVNNGTFQRIYEGSALNFSDNITYGWQTVAYRVRAYDSAGAVSNYATSQPYTVINNSAPTPPPYIRVPDEIRGGKTFEISWGTSTDVDGNLAGYRLERNVGGGFSQIYQGAERKFNDTVQKGTATVAYRVRAYDAENAQSDYTVSSTYTLINNTPPVINGGDGDLGIKDGAFSVPYMVLDADGDAITIVEKLDGKVLRSFAAGSEQEYRVTIDTDAFLQTLNGIHTLTITAVDASGASAVRTWTWSKKITRMSVTLKEPIPLKAMPKEGIANINGAIPMGVLVTMEVCNNGFDETPAWENCSEQVAAGQTFGFTNEAKTAEQWGFNFRVKVDRNGAEGPCYISSVSGSLGDGLNTETFIFDGGDAFGRK